MSSPGENTPARWRDPVFLAEADAWIAEHVHAVGPIVEHRAMGWSVVRRVPTSDGPVWFKGCAPEHAYEVAILERLVPHETMPAVLGTDRARGFVLLRDAGISLRELELGPMERERTWERALERYALLQRETVAEVETLVADGVPDRRPHALRPALEALADDRELLQPDAEYGLTDVEIERLRAGIGPLVGLAEELSQLGLPDAVEHNDVHDGNILVRDGELRVVDWGDACIAHPFCSVALVRHLLDLPLDASEARRRLEPYLAPWSDRYPDADVVASLERAFVVGDVVGALKWHGVMRSLGAEERDELRRYIPGVVRRVLAHL